MAPVLASTKIASGFTVEDYRSRRETLDATSAESAEWNDVRGAFRRRIEERFLRPIDRLLENRPSEAITPGFAVLALDCLLIDTLQAFREGRAFSSEQSVARSFGSFLKGARFACFSRRDRSDFFRQVRSALLHNGETRGNWIVRRGRSEMLTRTDEGRVLDRTLFHRAIVEEFEDYLRELEVEASETRERFLRRMDAICGLTTTPVTTYDYFAYGSNLLDSELAQTVPGAEPVGMAHVPCWRLSFTKHSVKRGGDAASIEPCASNVVWGFVYRIAAADWPRLVAREQGYEQVQLTALIVDDPTAPWSGRPATVETFRGDHVCTERCGPPRSYVELVLKGAEEKGLPADYLRALEQLLSEQPTSSV